MVTDEKYSILKHKNSEISFGGFVWFCGVFFSLIISNVFYFLNKY